MVQLVAAVALMVLIAVGAFLVRGGLSGDGDRTAGPAPVPTPTAPAPSAGPTIPADAVPRRVTKIVDGDTLDTEMGRIRLYGIDTPEVGEPSADEATAALAQQAPEGSVVWLWRPPGGDDKDQCDRLVRIVIRPDGTEANRTLVSAGLARAFRYYSERYVPEENLARAARLGIWSDAQVPVG